MAEEKEENKPKKKTRKKRSLFSKTEKEFIKKNYKNMTDEQLGKAIGRSTKAVSAFRIGKKWLKGKGAVSKSTYTPSRYSYLSTLDEDEKEQFFRNELRKSVLYRSIQTILDREHLNLYEQKYVEFMMDPTIETVTAMERDIWHEMTLAQIREINYLKKEKDPWLDENGNERHTSYAREIEKCQEIIRRCQESLNVERRQRLKNSTDQAINFTQVIKELRSAALRRKVGDRAAMLKYIAERHYNDHLGKNIISGAAKKYDLDDMFKGGKEPEGLDGDFTGDETIKKEEQEGLTSDKEQTDNSN
jgi:hypothetical protein